ncbi:MAG: cytochrome P450 [Ktedonobacterales bacterium]
MAAVAIEARPLAPLVRGWPVLGSTWNMMNQMIPFLVKTYQQLGPIFRVRALNQELVIMAGPEANSFVAQQGADIFSSHHAWAKFTNEFGVDLSILNADGEQHARLRKFFKHDFSATNLMSDIPDLINIAQLILDRLNVGEEISALTLFRSIVTEQLGRTLAHYSPAGELDDMVRTVHTALNVYAFGQWPKWMVRLPAYQRSKRCYLNVGQTIVAQHRENSRARPDLVDTALRASRDDAYHFAFGTEEQIVFMALSPFVAGLDTVTNECTFMLYALLHHPNVLEQCRQDADRIFADGVPDLNQLKSAHALHHAMMETLRCYAIAPGVDRTATQTFEFAGYRVEQGQRVFLASTVAHFLPELYADPLKFDITRYDEPRKEHQQKGAYAPFGIGTHLCLGAGAAQMQIMLVMATLLRTLRVKDVSPRASLPIKNDPTPTLGKRFKIRVAERRYHIPIVPKTTAPVRNPSLPK